jgi:hypothetical protein
MKYETMGGMIYTQQLKQTNEHKYTCNKRHNSFALREALLKLI